MLYSVHFVEAKPTFWVQKRAPSPTQSSHSGRAPPPIGLFCQLCSSWVKHILAWAVVKGQKPSELLFKPDRKGRLFNLKLLISFAAQKQLLISVRARQMPPSS